MILNKDFMIFSDNFMVVAYMQELTSSTNYSSRSDYCKREILINMIF